MKKSLLLFVAVAVAAVAFAQGQGQNPNPDYVAFTQRWYNSAQDVGRSHNNSPTFFVYPDSKVDEAGAKALLEELGMLATAEANQSVVFVLNPVGEKYDAKADFDAFVEMFNRARSGNLKVVGVGAGELGGSNQLLVGAVFGICTVNIVLCRTAEMAESGAAAGKPVLLWMGRAGVHYHHVCVDSDRLYPRLVGGKIPAQR